MNDGAHFIILTVVGVTAFGCASLGKEQTRVRTIAESRIQAHELSCTPADLTIYLESDEGSTREWVAGCNFKAIRVRCLRGSCDQIVERTWREELYGELGPVR